ncbi:MAG: hypothetical protein C4541_09045 [Candidatus Auribacter fodinae]|jgi:lipopolysaccharide export system protein LptA|uniref:Organic solvent tolerance-like N-terminal domain-containing protein n=1 Tax=Candidatus Auribacter fodinae TaxID=2093366 RepID=A0A3A4QVN1_9BACT|nr:MAG: hypothetical protein C4541_09045 [Candidatus Auribacter fodinae]
MIVQTIKRVCGLLAVLVLSISYTSFAEVSGGTGGGTDNGAQPYEPTVITCDGALDVAFDNNIAVFHDNVVVKDNRGEVYADLMTVYFKQESRNISLIEAEGNVIIHVDSKIAKSEKAVYKVNEGTLELTGNPRIHEDKNIYAAEKITIFQKNGKTEMKLEPKARLILYHENTGVEDGLFF